MDISSHLFSFFFFFLFHSTLNSYCYNRTAIRLALAVSSLQLHEDWYGDRELDPRGHLAVVAWIVEDLRPFPIHKMPRWEHQTLNAPSWHLHWGKWLGLEELDKRISQAGSVFPGAHMLLLHPCGAGRAVVSKSWSAPISFKTNKETSLRSF